MSRPRWQKVAIAAGGLAVAYAAERATIGRARRSVDLEVVRGFALPAGAVAHTIEVSDGGSVRAVEYGEGPPVVLLHGVTHSSKVWGWQFADLHQRHRVIALDHRGHGESIPGRDPWTIARLAADAAEVIEALDLRGALVVGHSLGGIVAQQLAVDRPDLIGGRMAGLALMATTAGGLSVGPAAWTGVSTAAVKVARRGMTAAGRVQDRLLAPSDLSWALFRLGIGSSADPTHVELTRQLTAATPFSTLYELMEDVVGFDLRDRLGGIDAPVLVMVGTRDVVTPPRDSRVIAANIPGARLEVFGGAGHMLMLERRSAVSELLARFALELRAKGSVR